jgi:hypothetical protein
MPVSQSIWRITQPPQRLRESALTSEKSLETMIIAAPEIVSDQWMMIGQQEDTGFGGRIDLLAIAPDSSLILIEIKRGRSPREVVAQAIDYATWVEALDSEAVFRIYSRFKPGCDLAKDFQTRFGVEIDGDEFPNQHQIVIVAASLDASSERIVSYLSKRSVAINVLCFEVFENGNEQLLSRAWLRDPTESQLAAGTTVSKSAQEPWNGEFYVSFGSRSWDDAVKYGFISAGGGAWYSNTLKLLKPGDRIWVKAPGYGFVGVGRVKGLSTPGREFRLNVEGEEKLAPEVLTSEPYKTQFSDNAEKMEYFVPVDWAQTVPLKEGINEPGLFGNRNSVCAPKVAKWRLTIDRLQQAFPDFDSV